MNSIFSQEPTTHHHSYFEGFPFFRMHNDLHSDLAIYFVTEGAFVCGIGGEERQTVSQGQAIICPPNTNFSKKVLRTVSMHLVRISFPESFPVTALPTEPIDFSRDPRITDTLERLAGLICAPIQISEVYKRHLINDLWFSLCALIQTPFTKYREINPDPFFSELCAYLDSHPSAQLSDLADAFHCSRVTVSRCFRRVAGKTVGQYAAELRLGKACSMLESTDEPLKVIAGRCGFSSEYYFSAVFREMTGCSPGKWRLGRRSKNTVS